MNYNRYYPSSSTQQPKLEIKSGLRNNFNVHIQNPKETQYWMSRKDDISNDYSPHSSHSINTPLKLNNSSTSSISRPVSKETFSNKVENAASYSKFSRISETIPLEKKLSNENNASSIKNYSLNYNTSKSTISNVFEEEKNFPTSLNFKKKEENASFGYFENLKKNSLEIDSKQESSKNCIFPYNPKQKIKREMAGLRNIGNTCFLNSTLQCLFNTPQFSDFFLEGEHLNQINQKNEKGIAEEFARLLKKVRGSKSYSAESTFGVKSALSKYSSKFSGFDQEDAQEFLIILLQGLVNDLNRVKQKPKYKELDDNLKNKTLQNLSDEWCDYFRKFDDSIVNDYFEGQLLSELKCEKCGKISLTFDNFFDVSLSFTRGLKMVLECDLERLLEHFTKEEAMEEDSIICSKCKKTSFTKKLTFWKLPRILVIHLKRFNFGRFRRDKLDNAVKFPLKDLDFSKFVTLSKDKSVKDCCLYDCFGIVNHSGSLYGGHYTSESMSPFDRKWYKYNDDHVSEVYNMEDKNYKNYGSSNAYMLFYAKKNLFP